MSTYTMTTTVELPHHETVNAVRAALGEEGFGILAEIDLAATLKDKLDVDVPPNVILGACRPVLAHAAIESDPSVAALLPCNVVVRSVGDRSTVVEAVDPDVMMHLTDSKTLETIAAEARRRLAAALAVLD
jgi:uncharacterized protein (DUF302 family)